MAGGSLAHPALDRYGWADASQALEGVDIARLSPKLARLRIPPLPLYRPQTPETLAVTVPAEALNRAQGPEPAVWPVGQTAKDKGVGR